MNRIRIAGVPEHFNFPWQLSIENRDFESQNIDLQWTNVPEGTGKLCQMLRNNETDLAVILTEGIIKDILAGNSSKIVQVYVKTPLIWGIHVAANSNFYTLNDLKNTRAAISRKGSGSELMAFVNAHNQNWPTKDLQFEIVNTIDGAVEALTHQKADYFMWERFMTKPLVDQGIFRRLDDCLTPWPSFVIVATDNLIKNQPHLIDTILEIINIQTSSFKKIPNITTTLADQFNQKKEDIEQWISRTEWSQEPITEEVLNNVQNQLVEVNIIDKKGTFAELALH
ncbi:substrate-binding domain-containing protein [Flavobacterium sp.]|uniref:substrate-binding domain-containing protein n=1 Tax=Flavobacterium sp. TaxID=239 RepID=UPI00261001EE|nr:substrate-binding domain-containing protein [Flavobacterium sp.]MDD3004069.1 substrate-binding domain-containing protein [Flavobacterium sp.]